MEGRFLGQRMETDFPHNVIQLDYSEIGPSLGFREMGALWHNFILGGWACHRPRTFCWGFAMV